MMDAIRLAAKWINWSMNDPKINDLEQLHWHRWFSHKNSMVRFVLMQSPWTHHFRARIEAFSVFICAWNHRVHSSIENNRIYAIQWIRMRVAIIQLIWKSNWIWWHCLEVDLPLAQPIPTSLWGGGNPEASTRGVVPQSVFQIGSLLIPNQTEIVILGNVTETLLISVVIDLTVLVALLRSQRGHLRKSKGIGKLPFAPAAHSHRLPDAWSRSNEWQHSSNKPIRHTVLGGALSLHCRTTCPAPTLKRDYVIHFLRHWFSSKFTHLFDIQRILRIQIGTVQWWWTILNTLSCSECRQHQHTEKFLQIIHFEVDSLLWLNRNCAANRFQHWNPQSTLTSAWSLK